MKITCRLKGCRERLGALGVHTGTDNAEAAAAADVVELAVKPQQLRGACREIAPAVAERSGLVISIAAGIGTPSLQSWLGADAAIVRCMPNTPALYGAAITALFANDDVVQQQAARAEEILRAAGEIVWVKTSPTSTP